LGQGPQPFIANGRHSRKNPPFVTFDSSCLRILANMDFDQLNTFVAVADLGNFSRAGERVFRSQSAVSAQIRQLEEEYGAKLFDRTKKAARLTPSGELLLEHARRLIAARDESLRAVADAGKDVRGVLSIGANETTFLYVLPGALSRYHQKNPRVRISVYRNFSHKVVQKVEDDHVELGVVTLPVRSPLLEVMPVFRDPLVWIAPPDGPLGKRGKSSLAKIAEHGLIFHKTGSMRRLMEKQLRSYRDHLHISMELTSAELVKKFVAAGLGASMISKSFVEDEVRNGTLKILDVDEETTYRELGIVMREGKTLSRAAQAFIAEMSSAAADGLRPTKSLAITA
jgi:DNA-binding transcriptional LysR family regulator